MCTKSVKRSKPTFNVARGQAMFQRIKPSPSVPYIVPALSHNFALSISFCSNFSDESPIARQDKFLPKWQLDTLEDSPDKRLSYKNSYYANILLVV